MKFKIGDIVQIKEPYFGSLTKENRIGPIVLIENFYHSTPVDPIRYFVLINGIKYCCTALYLVSIDLSRNLENLKINKELWEKLDENT